MSIRIEEPEFGIENYDICGNTTQKILVINGIRIPLCGSCLDELKKEINDCEV